MDCANAIRSGLFPLHSSLWSPYYLTLAAKTASGSLWFYGAACRNEWTQILYRVIGQGEIEVRIKENNDLINVKRASRVFFSRKGLTCIKSL